MNFKKDAFGKALPYTLPICAGFLFLGVSYGFYMSSEGFNVLYPIFMSMFIFAGSMEFVTANLLLSAFNPLSAFILAFMVNARHLFYGISMLERYKNTGKKKFYLIYGMCDESFSINCNVKIPEGTDKGWFMIFVNLLNQFYWVFGAALGAILGKVIHINTKGIEFVLTALFVMIFVEQWEEVKNHIPAIIGVALPLVCLILIGKEHFIIPSMLLIVMSFIGLKKWRILK